MGSDISGKLCFPRDCPTSVASEEWGVGTVGAVGSLSGTSREWDQWAVGSRSGISGEWEAGVGPVGLMESRIRSEWNQEWV